MCQLSITPAQTYSEFVRFGRCFLGGPSQRLWKNENPNDPPHVGFTRCSAGKHLQPPGYGFTHHCTDVQTTPPKTEGTKQESNPCLRITTQLVLPEVYQRHQASVGPKQGPSLPLITVITLLEQRRAFSADMRDRPAPPGRRMLLSSEPADRTRGWIDSRQDTAAASGSVLCTDEFIFRRQRRSALHIITQQRLVATGW